MSNLYSLLEVEQGTDSWLQERIKHLTASQTPVVLGLSPYQTALQLFEEKTTGKIITDNRKKEIFAKGHQAEKASREWIESNLGFKLSPAVVVSIPYPDLLASLDGFNESKSIIMEAKLVSEEVLQKVKRGEIKPDHECQVQAQLKVTGAKKCIYFATTLNGNSAIVEIVPSPEYGSKIADLATEFMKNVRAGKAPEPTDKDYFEPRDSRFSDLCNMKIFLEKFEQEYNDLRQQLLEEYKEYARIHSGGLYIRRNIVRGTVDYSKIPELKKIDLEQYRKPSYERVDIRIRRDYRKKEE